MFKPNTLFYTDGYKPSHKKMLAPRTTKLYGTWIPRSTKHAPKGITKIVSAGQQLVWKWIHDEFQENFFNAIEYEYETAYFEEDGKPYQKPTGKVLRKGKDAAIKFSQDMSLYLGLPYDGKHFEELWDLGYLPIKVKALPEGIETNPNIPHMTFVNTVDGFAWLTLYLETIVSSLAWKPSTSATIALRYLRNVKEWVMKTDPSNAWLIPFMCHDFSARGLSPWDMLSSGLGHATSFRGSDSIICIPGARYFYNEPENEVCINSVNASEHSVSTTKIFTVGEQQMIADWLKEFDKGILSIVADTFDLWKLITEYLPANKEAIMARDGKLVIRPDSGDPVDIICGMSYVEIDSLLPTSITTNLYYNKTQPECVLYKGKFYTYDFHEFEEYDGTFHLEKISLEKEISSAEQKGVIELLWDIFGGTVNEQGYKVLDPHIGAIYGDSITVERQVQIYERLAAKGFAATNIVLGVGSFTYQFNTRDTLGFAAKGAWFECEGKEYNIYKDPITDDGTKKSLKGLLQVYQTNKMDDRSGIINYDVMQECTHEEENQGILQVIYQDGKFYNQTTLTQIREKINNLA